MVEITKMKTEIEVLLEKLKTKDREISYLNVTLLKFNNSTSEISSLKKRIAELTRMVEERDTRIKKLLEKIKDLEQIIKDLEDWKKNY